ncbi:MAG: hypothetical protein ACFFG0_53680, partial [Candidatus Thorarchaeota archaeon]
ILIGGFGRGEGSIIYKKKKFIPINDYDIYVVTSKKYPNALIEQMCKKASEAINKKCINFYDYSEDMEYDIEKTFYPDIRVLTLSELRKLPPFLKYFEIKNSTVIYGENVIKEIPNFNIKEIPDSEGFRFLMNRICLMIMHFPFSALKNLDEKNKERIINFNMKATLSCAEALLLLSKKFTASYIERAEILKKTYKKDFPELSQKIPELPKLVNKYTNQKLKPDYKNIENPLRDWFVIRDYSVEIIRFLLYNFTGTEIKNMRKLTHTMNKTYSRDYIKGYIKGKFGINNKILLNILNYPANYVLNLLYIKRIFDIKRKLCLSPLKHPFIPPDLKIFPAAIFIISSLNGDGSINERLFNESQRYLGQVYFDYPEIYKNKDWEGMRRIFGTIFNLYGFQKLI